jgi:hypothetical protein
VLAEIRRHLCKSTTHGEQLTRKNGAAKAELVWWKSQSMSTDRLLTSWGLGASRDCNTK